MMINDNGTIREATAEETAIIAELTAEHATEQSSSPEERLELLEAAVQELALMIGGEA